MPNQPTILVKKADGSQVRLTMDEFRIYKEERGNLETGKLRNLETERQDNKQQIADIKTKNNLPAEIHTEALATSAPVKEIFIDEAVFKKTLKQKNIKTKPVWTSEDHQSLLEEKDEEVKQKPAAASLPSARNDACAQVVKELKFSISDELMPRLRSLIVSRIKDIRSDEQAEAYALREVKNGGLGLNAAQAGELKKAINAQIGVKRGTRKEESVKRSDERGASGEILNKDKGYGIGNRRYEISDRKESNRNFGAGKPIIQDVTAPFPPGKQTVGPVDELGEMTLVNFRRLAANPSVAGKILLEKFKELKTESYLLYLDAVKAWRQSPLYRQYLAAMAEAINQRQRISALLAGDNKEQLKENEFMALVEVNGHL